MITCHPLLPDDFTVTPSTRTFQVKFNIHSTEPLTPALVEAAPETPSPGDRCPFFDSLFAQTVTFAAEYDAYHWTANVTYGTRTIEGDYKRESPWSNPPEIRNTTEFENVTQDYEYVDPSSNNGEETKPLLNLAEELYNPAPTKRVAIEIKQIRWWTRAWKDDWTVKFRDTVNAKGIYLDGLSYSPRTLWITQLLYNKYYFGNGNRWCWQIEAEIRYRQGTWLYRPIQASYHAKNPTTRKIEDIYEKDGLLYYASELSNKSGYTIITEPALLNKNGNLLTKNKAQIPSLLKQVVYGEHQLLHPVDWSGLAIPTLKGIKV